MLGSGVVVGREVSHALELEFGSAFGMLHYEGFELGTGHNFERLGVEHLSEVALGLGGWVFHVEETVVETHLGIGGMSCRYPV